MQLFYRSQRTGLELIKTFPKHVLACLSDQNWPCNKLIIQRVEEKVVYFGVFTHKTSLICHKNVTTIYIGTTIALSKRFERNPPRNDRGRLLSVLVGRGMMPPSVFDQHVPQAQKSEVCCTSRMLPHIKLVLPESYEWGDSEYIFYR